MKVSKTWLPSQKTIDETNKFLTKRAKEKGLTYDELVYSTPKEREALMRQRGTWKDPNIFQKTKSLLSKAYKAIGLKLGLLEKPKRPWQYTDID